MRTKRSEGDEDSTPSTEQRAEQEHRSISNGSIIKQMVTKDKEIVNSKRNTSELGWFGIRVTRLVETIACMGNKAGTGGQANITSQHKNNTQSQSEFSFFL